MSRIGKKPIKIPEGVEVKIEKNLIKIQGPLGKDELSFDERVNIDFENDTKIIQLTKSQNTKEVNSLFGLYRALISNMVEGVKSGFRKDLELVGVGYRVQKESNGLKMTLGFSHHIDIEAPEGITFEVEGNNKFSVIGINKYQVGQTAANIRKYRPPEPYKGKGIKYKNEYIRKKAGKSVK